MPGPFAGFWIGRFLALDVGRLSPAAEVVLKKIASQLHCFFVASGAELAITPRRADSTGPLAGEMTLAGNRKLMTPSTTCLAQEETTGPPPSPSPPRQAERGENHAVSPRARQEIRKRLFQWKPATETHLVFLFHGGSTQRLGTSPPAPRHSTAGMTSRPPSHRLLALLSRPRPSPPRPANRGGRSRGGTTRRRTPRSLFMEQPWPPSTNSSGHRSSRRSTTSRQGRSSA